MARGSATSRPVLVEDPADAGEARHPLGFERRAHLAEFLHGRGHRTRDLWHAMHGINEATTLSCVPREHRALLVHAKDLTTLLTVLIDDLADCTQDLAVFAELAAFLQRVQEEDPSHVAGDDRIRLAVQAWRIAVGLLRRGPRYREFRDLWLFDMAEMVQCQRYNLLLNREPRLANPEEYLVYGTHNFNVKPHMTMDLMFSPGFRREDLGPFRQALQHIQVAVQLVNDLYTAEREVGQEESVASYPIILFLAPRRGNTKALRRPGALRELRRATGRAVESRVRKHMARAESLLAAVTSFDVARFLRAVRSVETVYREGRGRL